MMMEVVVAAAAAAMVVVPVMVMVPVMRFQRGLSPGVLIAIRRSY
jgi:hypothetical protein